MKAVVVLHEQTDYCCANKENAEPIVECTIISDLVQ